MGRGRAVWMAAAALLAMLVAPACDRSTQRRPPGADAAPGASDAALPPPPPPAPADAAAPGADAGAGADRGPEAADAGAEGGADRAGSGDAPGAPLRCNGHQALCDRRFDQVVFPATHNAMSNSDDGWFGANQAHGISRQLRDGIRALLIDTHSYRGTIHLCHSVCLLGSKPLVEGLQEITRFLRENPAEVLMVIIEDGVPAADHDRAFADSGLRHLVYTHAAGRPWPTLRAMIAAGQRVVVGAENGRPPPAWFHHVWDLVWDTPYSFKNRDEFTCRPNRGKPGNDLFLLNHWIENPLPSASASEVANAREVLLGRARRCQMESGKLPNFVAVNHYSTGDLFSVVRELNGL